MTIKGLKIAIKAIYDNLPTWQSISCLKFTQVSCLKGFKETLQSINFLKTKR